MSQLYAAELREAIREAILTAWSVEKIHYGSVQLPQTVTPYAVVRLDSVPMEWLSVTDVEQRYRYECALVDKWAVDAVLEDVKVTKANALIAALMTSETFATYGMTPLVSQVAFEESDDPNEPLFMVQVDFEVVVHATGLGSEPPEIIIEY